MFIIIFFGISEAMIQYINESDKTQKIVTLFVSELILTSSEILRIH